MLIAWIHNFNNINNASSGIFMYQLHEYIKDKDTRVKIDLINIGNISNPVLIFLKYIKYRKLFKTYDILHSQYGSGTGLFVSLFPGKKLISLRGSDWYYYHSENIRERFHSWLACKLTHFSIKKSDGIIVMSDRMKDEVLTQFPFSDVTVITDGVDLTRFYPKIIEKKLFRILFSSIHKTNSLKRFELAEKAYNIFHRKYPESELVFMNNIPWTEVNDFINSVSVILLTSTHEGWPNIIKEGLACNVPFVSTDVSDLKTIAGLSDTCIVCDDNPESLASGIETVYKRNNVEEIRHLAFKFDILVAIDKLMDQYRKLIPGI